MNRTLAPKAKPFLRPDETSVSISHVGSEDSGYLEIDVYKVFPFAKQILSEMVFVVAVWARAGVLYT